MELRIDIIDSNAAPLALVLDDKRLIQALFATLYNIPNLWVRKTIVGALLGSRLETIAEVQGLDGWSVDSGGWEVSLVWEAGHHRPTEELELIATSEV